MHLTCSPLNPLSPGYPRGPCGGKLRVRIYTVCSGSVALWVGFCLCTHSFASFAFWSHRALQTRSSWLSLNTWEKDVTSTHTHISTHSHKEWPLTYSLSHRAWWSTGSYRSCKRHIWINPSWSDVIALHWLFHDAARNKIWKTWCPAWYSNNRIMIKTLHLDQIKLFQAYFHLLTCWNKFLQFKYHIWV